MNDERPLQFFSDAGLPGIHTKFAIQFLETDAPVMQVVDIPIGGGKGRFLLAIAKYVAAQGGRVLLLADRVEVLAQYRARLQDDNAMSINLDRPTMRSLQAGATIPRIHWQPGFIYTATIKFMSVEDIKPQILHTIWDLVIVDDVRSTKLPTDLISSSAYKRLLIILPGLGSRGRTGKFLGSDVHMLGTMNPDFQPRFNLEIVEFTRSKSELNLLQDILHLTKQLPTIQNLAQDFNPKLIRQRAASSFYALELTLTRLRHTMLALRNVAAHNSNIDTSEFALLRSTLELLNNLLVQLDEIGVDSKQQALSRLIDQLPEKHIIVFTNMSETAGYLRESYSGGGVRSHQVGGSKSSSDYSASWGEYSSFLDEFIESGGIAFISEARTLTGYDLRSVLSTVVLYDIPQNDTDLYVLVSRVNPQNGKVCLLRDTSTLLGDSLKTLNNRLAKLDVDIR